MTHLNGTTNHIKGKHLTEFERHQIQILKSENYSNRAIAKILNRAPQTINNEINRGTVKQIKRIVSNSKEYFYDYETPKYLFLKSLKSEGLLSEPLSYYLY